MTSATVRCRSRRRRRQSPTRSAVLAGIWPPRHAHLIVMLPMPGYMVDPAEYEQRKAALFRLGLGARAEAADPVRHRNDFAATRAVVRQAAQDAGATVYDPRLDLCAGTVCPYAQDGVSLYTDSNHIAASQMSILRPGMESAFRQALRSPASDLATVEMTSH